MTCINTMAMSISDTNYSCHVTAVRRTFLTNHMDPYHATNYKQPWGWTHTHTHTHTHTNMYTYRRPHQNNFKKPGVCWPVHTAGLIVSYIYLNSR